METIDFYPQTFHQIPDQDNPAFYGDECMMIVKECDPVITNSTRSLVLYVSPDSKAEASYVAIFWRHSMVVSFCKNSFGMIPEDV